MRGKKKEETEENGNGDYRWAKKLQEG